MAKLSHGDGEGKARMVDIGAKAVTRREAAASSFIKLGAATLRLVRANRIAKGDVLNTARPVGATTWSRPGRGAPRSPACASTSGAAGKAGSSGDVHDRGRPGGGHDRLRQHESQKGPGQGPGRVRRACRPPGGRGG